MVAKEVSANVKTKKSSNMITSQVSDYVWKIHSWQTIEPAKTVKK